MEKVKKYVDLTITHNHGYEFSPVSSYKKKYPQWRYYSASIDIDGHCVFGPRHSSHPNSILYATELVGCEKIKVESILKALNIPQEIINQIDFED